MHLFRPLSWISSSRAISPVASAEADPSPMTATLSNVANHFNSHATAHNERVYGGTKRKVADNSQKRNKEITDFFSSSPMGAQQSKEGSDVRGEKKRKFTHSSSSQDKENGPSAQRIEGSSKGTPVWMRGKAEPPARLSDSDSAQSNEDAISQTTSRLNSFESRTTASPPPALTTNNHDNTKTQTLKTNRNTTKMNARMTAEEREKERKRQIVVERMRNGQRPSWTSPFYQMDPKTETHLVDDLRESFRHQINLEVKLQHEKIQEIRAEMAKSQIALEQLRRCHLIPFPQAFADPEDMLNIMEGTGPAIPQANGAKPQWATPFGVTEGAYTRHYVKWLIPDSRFDGVVYQQPQAQQSGYPFPNMDVRVDGRQTRNSFQLDPVPTNKRRGRGDVSVPLQALSSGYTQKKEDAGPSVLKRGDGQWVKLVCLDCHRENFGSTQGFINHCRIAHKREFKSHEEAAVNSGQVVEVDQFGGLVGEEKLPASVVYSYEGLVHHKIREAPLDWSKAKDVLEHVNGALRQFREGSLAGIDHIPGEKADPLMSSSPAAALAKPKPNKDFVPSASTPHLSALLKNRGFNKSLDSSVAAAKAPVIETPYTASDAEDDEDAIVVAGIPHQNKVNNPARPQFRAPILPNMRPSSSSSNHAPILPPIRQQVSKSKKSQSAVQDGPQMQKAREVQAKINAKKPSPPAPAFSTEARMDDAGDATDTTLIVEEDSDVELLLNDDLSPAIHSEGDKAPSLVSDDDDYTAESEGESDGSNDDTEAAESEDEVKVREESDEARSRKRTASRDELEGSVVAERGGKINKRSKKGVSFVSPVKDIKKAKGRR